MKNLSIILLVILALLPGVATAQVEAKCVPVNSAAATKALERVQSSYNKLVSFEAKFKQSSYMVGLDESRESEGEMLFKKTAKMDWRYLTPTEQRFTTDGQTVWFYQPELNQVSVGEFQQAFSSDLPVSFLLGLNSLTESFKLSSACETPNDMTFYLTPSSVDGSISSFELGVLKKDYLPRVAKITDVGGNENTIILSISAVDAEIADKKFVFEIPKGVDVLEQRSAAETTGAAK